MPRLRKQRRRKVYRHNVNRKRLKKRMFSTGSIGCKEVKNAWENNKSVQRNLLEMGLSYDPNKSIKSKMPMKNARNPRDVKRNNEGWSEEEMEHEVDLAEVPQEKANVVDVLIKDARAPRVKLFRLPKGHVERITSLIDRYGGDYRAMAKDEKNYNQETWKQLRAKVRRFKSIPEQYNEYLQKSGKSDVPSEGEYDSDD